MFPGGFNAGLNVRRDPDDTELGKSEQRKIEKIDKTEANEQKR
jgi:hypothetical protein